MPERSYPFVDGPTTDAEFSAMFRLVFPSSVVGYPQSQDLKPYSDSNGRQVKLRTGAAFVRGHRYLNDSELALPIAANTSGMDRFDRVVLRLEYGAVRSIRARILQGVPGGDVPALTNTETGIAELSLGTVEVNTGVAVIAPAKVLDDRKFWGLELLRMAGVVISPSAPSPASAFLHIKSL